MRKFFAFFLLISIFFLSGCVQKDLIDIYVFADRFSRYSKNFEIDTEKFMAEEETDSLSFPIVFDDKFLITVRVSKETSLIQSVSVVYAYRKERKISDEDFSSLKEIIKCSVRSFTNFENTDDIFENLSFGKKGSVYENHHEHFKKEFYEFSLVTNDIGIYFFAKTERR